MAKPTGFSVPPSEKLSSSDISGLMNISSSSAQSTNLSMEEKKLKSHEGKAVVMSAQAASSAGPIVMVTERNVQLHTANQKPVGTSHGGSVVSSAERSRRYEKARAAFEMAEARVAMLQAAEEMAAGSQTGSVGRRLDDVRSDTGSSGPSPPIRETAKENLLRAFSPRRLLRQFPHTPTIYDIVSEKREVHIIDEIGIPSTPIVISATAGSPPSGSVVSATAGSIPVGGMRPMSVVSATAGSLIPRDVMSATAASSRSTPKHDRHGNLVSAPAAQSPLGSVVSATAAPDQVVKIGFDASVDLVPSASHRVAAFPHFKGEVIANKYMDYLVPEKDKTMPKHPTDGFESPREMGHGLEPTPPLDGVNSATAGSSLPLVV